MAIKPRRLEKGMTIGLVAPASAVPDLKLLDPAIERLHAEGYNVVEGKHIRDRYGYLASHDSFRLADLHAAFANKRVDAIMCVRGGYGAMRLLPFIDFGLIRRNPKILLGFSDITALQLAIWKECGLVTFNGPMLLSLLGKGKPSPFTWQSCMRTIAQNRAPGSVWQGHRDRNFRVVASGTARGSLTGGNLSLVASTLGTPWEVVTRGKVVFLEDLDEKPYRVDRMLTQLLLAGKLRDAAAVVFGRNVPDAETAMLERKLRRKGLARKVLRLPRKVSREYQQPTDDVIADLLGKLGIPVLVGLPFGHIDHYATLPIGVKASVDTRTGELSVDEPAVA